MPVIYEIVAHGEKYTNAAGEEKSRLLNIGKVIKKDNGKLSLKLDAIPVNFDGWAMLLPPKPREEDQPQQRQQRRGGDDGDVPFADPYKGRRSSVV